VSAGRHRILYDPDCGFCRWALAWVLRWDRDAKLVPTPLGGPVADRLLASMPETERTASWHLVATGGEVRSGGAAAAPLLRLLPGGRAPAALVERMPSLVERSYRLVACNRSRLGRRLPRSAIARADEVIADRL
jgi:predicted DCC family thiol-disulfide oxidoreductase YuxK